MKRLCHFTSIFVSMIAIALTANAQKKVPTLDEAAIGKIEAGDLDGAAEALAGRNSAAKLTLPWYQQSALALLNRSNELRATGHYEAAKKSAAAAIQIMTHGVTKSRTTASPGNRSQMYIQLAQASERHLGDRAAARQYYRQALEELPDSKVAAAALARFDEEDRQAERIKRRGRS